MYMIEEMTGAAEAQDEVVEVPYEKSGALIGGLAGVVARGGVEGEAASCRIRQHE